MSITFLDFIRKVTKERRGRGFVVKGGKGSGWYAPPKGTHGKGKGEKAKNHIFITLPKTRMSEAFNTLRAEDKLKPTYAVGVAREALLDKTPDLIDDMLKDPRTRERVITVIQNLTTGDLQISRTKVGKWGQTQVPSIPKGFRRIGMIHAHPPAHPLRPSEPDMWKLNPIMRHGGFFGIAGIEKGQRGVRAWEWHKGEGNQFDLYASRFYPVEG